MSDVVRIRVRGHSMRPSLADGDELEVALGAPVAAGDVVLFMEGTLPVLHRVLSIREGRVLTQGEHRPKCVSEILLAWQPGKERLEEQPDCWLGYGLARHLDLVLEEIWIDVHDANQELRVKPEAVARRAH